MAASTASAPPLKNWTRLRSPGPSEAISFASSARGFEVKLPTVTAWSCAVSAAT
ncbi:hypothetical protein D3C83_221070 [compost metagenome]